jgi:hypothetical protein
MGGDQLVGHPLGPLLARCDAMEDADWANAIPRYIRRADVPALARAAGD